MGKNRRSIYGAPYLFVVALLLICFIGCNQSPAISSPSGNLKSKGPERVAYGSVMIEPTSQRPAVDQVKIAPQHVVIGIGENLIFTAVAIDIDGRVLLEADFSWKVTDVSAGVINSSGLFTALSKPGVYSDLVELTVISGNGIVTAKASVEVVEELTRGGRILDSVIVYPSDITVRPGQVIGLGAIGWDKDGKYVQGLKFQWDMVDQGAGTVNEFGFYTASSSAGRYENVIKITALQNSSEGNRERVAYVSVTISDQAIQGELGSVVVMPGRVTLTPRQRVDFIARAFDNSGRPLRDVSFSWDVSQPQSGKMTQPGYFISSPRLGEYPDAIEVVATQQSSNGIKQAIASITVTVVPEPEVTQMDSAQVLPRTVVLSHGQRFVFNRIAVDINGNAVRADARWEVIDPRVGKISEVGVFTAGIEPGQYSEAVKVRLTQEIDGLTTTVEAYADINILGPLSRVVIVPSMLTVQAGESFRLGALGYDSNGLGIPLIRLKWNVENSRVGTVDESGLFVAGDDIGIFDNSIKVSAVEIYRS